MSRNTDTTQARATRRLRATELGRVERGVYPVRELLRTPPGPLDGVDLYDVLLRVSNLGRRGIQITCERAQVWPHIKMQDLLEDEVERLIDSLPERVFNDS